MLDNDGVINRSPNCLIDGEFADTGFKY